VLGGIERGGEWERAKERGERGRERESEKESKKERKGKSERGRWGETLHWQP